MEKKLGVLCHVTSLASKFGVGDFGQSSKDFIDFLADSNITIWQILPLNETNEYNCPYASTCYFSYDEMMVDPEELVKKYKVEDKELNLLRKLSKTKKVDFTNVKSEKKRLLGIAYNNLTRSQLINLKDFIKKNPLVFDYAYYKALLEINNTINWRNIDSAYWSKRTKKYKEFIVVHEKNILRYAFAQKLLIEEWQKIRAYAKSKNVSILGDLPIYPDPNSFDVFNNPEMFQVDPKTFEPLVFGGVPKDEFCEEGQNWHTCIYNWDYLKDTNYKAMLDKIKLLLQKYDILRLDHFLGYTDHYEIDAKNPSKGKWVKAGGQELFNLISKEIDINNIVIEDLGLTKVEATKVRNEFELCGMCVIQMIMESKNNLRYLPDKVVKNSIYYLGTHDNNTFIGYLKSLPKKVKTRFCELMKIDSKNIKQIHLECIRKMINSKSQIVVLQMQDLLMQDGKFRMNIPGQAAGCWDYKMPKNYQKIVKNTLSLL